MSLEYVRECYGVPAHLGRRVTVYGRPGIISLDCGHYIGVTFDGESPTIAHTAHPTDGVVYGEMGKLPKLTRAQKQYREYLKVADLYENFSHWLRVRSARRRGGDRG